MIEFDAPTILLAAVGIIACYLLFSMLAPFAADIYRKVFKGELYATRDECTKKHQQMEKDCAECKKAMQNTICAIRHDSDRNHQESEKNRKLLVLIAFRLRISHDELKDFL